MLPRSGSRITLSRILLVGLAITLLFLINRSCTEQPTTLERVQNKGQLVVLTRNSPTTYYEGPDGPTGFEYDLAKLFAEHLGVNLKIVTANTFGEVIPRTAHGDVHLAAAGLTVTEERAKRVRFGPVYQEITQQLVYRAGKDPPRRIEDVIGGTLEVMAGSSHVERLKALKLELPALAWKENTELESEELLSLVWEKKLDYTIADSNEVALNQRFYPELRVAFDLTEPQQLGWAIPKSKDDTLYNAAVDFFNIINANGKLKQIIERHYGHVSEFDYVGTRKFMQHFNERLPRFKAMFMQAGVQSGIDWRLLAAIGYQESHWDPRAASPTGVRGIMMLTRTTAAQLGITNRLDPDISIRGGATYISHIIDQIPGRIPEPDRTWLALAAYNIGFGHLEDARKIAQQRASDPDKWIDLKENLPLLRQKKWHNKTRYGYARGNEAVVYVENIRSYFDLMIWMTDPRPPRPDSTINELAPDIPTILPPVL